MGHALGFRSIDLLGTGSSIYGLVFNFKVWVFFILFIVFSIGLRRLILFSLFLCAGAGSLGLL